MQANIDHKTWPASMHKTLLKSHIATLIAQKYQIK
jgi:hypothetical protein